MYPLICVFFYFLHSGLGEVDKFMIENGTVGTISADMLDGITIRRNISVVPAFPKHHGAFIMKNTKITGAFPSAMFADQTLIYELVLRVSCIDTGGVDDDDDVDGGYIKIDKK